jgi:hypothetical protein
MVGTKKEPDSPRTGSLGDEIHYAFTSGAQKRCETNLFLTAPPSFAAQQDLSANPLQMAHLIGDLEQSFLKNVQKSFHLFLIRGTQPGITPPPGLLSLWSSTASAHLRYWTEARRACARTASASGRQHIWPRSVTIGS